MTEWIAAYQKGLLDDFKPLMEVVDLAGANVAATLANIHRAQDSRPYNLLDFALLAEKPDPDQDDMEASLEAALTRFCD